jgi:hypothetical protein
MTTAETLAIGELVISASSLAVVGVGASTTITINSATQKILGCTMQACVAPADELLVLLGGDGISAGNV